MISRLADEIKTVGLRLLVFCLPLFINAQQLNIIPFPQSCKIAGPDAIIWPEGYAKKTEWNATSLYDSIIGEEGYKISINAAGIHVASNTQQGYFYASETIKKLETDSSILPMEITDYPAYQWRGMHLDVSRHFFPKEVIEQYLDLMARLKMNVFHWHLTDDQGWRIEIKKYPKLTEVGAWRTEKDGSKYGGYYTQEDIKEIVAYAAERFITVVPEIEMPGHSSAAIAAYPELSCVKGPKKVPNKWGIFKDIYSSDRETDKFLQDVLDEVCALFPGPYIHLGGDEAPKKYWNQTYRKSWNTHRVDQLFPHYSGVLLQAATMDQMRKYVATKGKQAIVWGDAIKGGVSDSMIVMSWVDKHAGRKAAKKGNPVVMTPRFFCYFDYPQSLKDKRPSWWMTYLPLRKVYRFKPVCKSLTAGENKQIMGGQANVWTEHINDKDQLFRHAYRRLYAMSEALWSGGGNFKEFKKRLAVIQPKLIVAK